MTIEDLLVGHEKDTLTFPHYMWADRLLIRYNTPDDITAIMRVSNVGEGMVSVGEFREGLLEKVPGLHIENIDDVNNLLEIKTESVAITDEVIGVVSNRGMKIKRL